LNVSFTMINAKCVFIYAALLQNVTMFPLVRSFSIIRTSLHNSRRKFQFSPSYSQQSQFHFGAFQSQEDRKDRKHSTITRSTTLYNNYQKTNISTSSIKQKQQRADQEILSLSKKLDVTVPVLLERLKKTQKSQSRVSGSQQKMIDDMLKYTTLIKKSDNKPSIDQNAKQSKQKGDRKNMKNKQSEVSPTSSTKKKMKSTRIRPVRPTSKNNLSSKNSPQTNEEVLQNQQQISDSIVDKSMLSQKTFAQNPYLSQASKRAISHKMGLTHMTEVQAKTFEAVYVEKKDVLARARTGTGKTLAFLLPSIEALLQEERNSKKEADRDSSIGMLVISPTRELATQIGEQAKILCENRMKVQVMYGGVKLGKDINALSRGIPKVLIATPGRLLDHLQSTRINGRSFSDILGGIKFIVLDETDRLLDMGFRRDIEKIISFLPSRNRTQRQTLLFSATIPDDLKPIMKQTMRESDSIIVDCINDKDSKTVTNEHIIQSHVIVPSIDQYVTSLIQIVLQAKAEGGTKIIVFFPTARLVSYFAELFSQVLGIAVMEIHSKKSQAYRNRASEQFRSSNKAVLFTSDVSARGVDYPDVSHVIQFGIPDSKETYLHRLGRTGRAGKKGKGWLVLQSFEARFLNELKRGANIDLPENSSLLLPEPTENQVIQDSLNRLNSHLTNMKDKTTNTENLEITVSQAYQAFLGYYKGQMKRISLKEASELVVVANEISKQMGMNEPPFLEKRTVGKMGLKGVEGIRIGNVTRRTNRSKK